MNTRHRPLSYSRTTVNNQEVVRVGCECGHRVLAAALTAAEAWQVARRVREHHRGSAAAAGPGGETP